jgi:cysteine synthase A
VEAVTLAPGQTEVVCVVAKRVTQPPYCAELGHLAPARLAERERCALAEYARQVLDALEMHAGVSHGEYRLTEEGPMLMEVAGRPAGGSIPRLVDLVTGCNLYRAELSAATGTPIPRTQAAHRSAAVHFFTGNGATATYRPLTIDEATAPPLAGILHDLRYWVPPETVLRVPQDVDDRAGLALVAGEPDQVDAAMAALVARAAGPAVAGEAD